MTSSFTLTASRVSFSAACARVASRAFISRCALSTAMSLFWRRSSVDHLAISSSMPATSRSSASSASRFERSTPSWRRKRAIERSTSWRELSIVAFPSLFSSTWLRSRCSLSTFCAVSVGSTSAAPFAICFFLRSRRLSISCSFFESERLSTSWRRFSSVALRCISSSSLVVTSAWWRARSISTFFVTASTSRWRCAIVSTTC